MTKIKHKEKILGLLVSILFILLIVWNLDTKQLIATFKIFDYRTLILFVPLYVLSLLIRGYRWQCLLYDSTKLSLQEAFFTFTTGNTINSYLPARAGDFWRAFHVGKKLKESKMKILGSIILERIIDGISVLLILFFAVFTYFKKPWVMNIAYVAAILFLGSFSVFYFLQKYNKIDVLCNYLSSLKYLSNFKPLFEKIKEIFNKFMEGFKSLNNPKNFCKAFTASCIAWGIECFLTYLIITGFGQNYGFSISLFVISFIALSTIIPSSSIFVGPYQYAYILALGIYKVTKSNALAIAFIHQISIMVIITVITIIYLLKTDKSLTNIKEEIEENSNANYA